MLCRALVPVPEVTLKPLAAFVRFAATSCNEVVLHKSLSHKEFWSKRIALQEPKIQRFETVKPKLYYAPEWDLDEKADKDEGFPDPLKKYGMTPEKWEYYNKAGEIMTDVLNEAKKRAAEEFFIEFPSEMHVAEAFAIQCNIIKSARRHAHEKWCRIRHRYIHVFVRLEEGDGPGLYDDIKDPNGWEQMEEYYDYLRSRSIKYSI